jgi:thioredoxin reductase (NADPH)
MLPERQGGDSVADSRRPVIVAVERNNLERDTLHAGLVERYGDRFRVVAVDGRAQATQELRQLREADTLVALLVTEATVEGGSGIQLLEEVRERHPEARCVLLTDQRDLDVAVEAINRVHLDRYLVKPVEPLADRLYPALDDLLGEWYDRHGDNGTGIQVIGHRFAAGSYEIKDFLTRNLVPFRWLDVDDPAGHGRAIAGSLGLAEPYLTTVILGDGTVLTAPSLPDLAGAMSLTAPIKHDFYDVIVIGGGPAGLAAAVYTACEGRHVLVVEAEAPGGQAGSTSRIENYLGFPGGLNGSDLAQRALSQAMRFGVEWAETRIATQLAADGDYRFVTLDDGTRIGCNAVLVATGMKWRRLDVPGAAELVDAGVYYGACLTEALECAGEDVYMLGSGNSAGQAALYFAQTARSVTLLVREASLRQAAMSSYLADRIEDSGITVVPHTEVAGVTGTDQLTAITLLDNQAGRTREVPASSLYVLIGSTPSSDWLEGTIGRDPAGFILTATDVRRQHGQLPAPWPLTRDPLMMETSMPGVFAAGDVRAGSVKRIGSAVGEGAISVQAISEYLRGLHPVDPLHIPGVPRTPGVPRQRDASDYAAVPPDSEELLGVRVTGTDGIEIGIIEQVFDDDVRGIREWARVRKPGLAGERDHFVPVGVGSIADGTCRLPYTSQKVTEAPPLNIGQHITGEDGALLRTYYGIGVITTSSTAGATAER